MSDYATCYLDGDNILCDDKNWFKCPRALFDLREQGDLSLNELGCLLFLYSHANPSNALFTTSMFHLKNFLGVKSRTTAKDVLYKLKEKGYVEFETNQGKHSFQVKVIHYPYRKRDRKSTQTYSKANINSMNLTEILKQKREVNPESVKSELADSVTDSASFFKLTKSGVKSPE